MTIIGVIAPDRVGMSWLAVARCPALSHVV